MDLSLAAAIFIGKIISKINKLKGTGGTAAPGLYGLKIDPNLIKKSTTINNLKSVVISGTNGKTTTARLISSIVDGKIIHNRQGSNLLRGLASTLISESTVFGKVKQSKCLWEADEAALVEIASQVNIKFLVLLNLFRDQLDRYGEIDTIRKKWQAVVKSLPKKSTLILNADDPSTNYLKGFAKCKTVMFGVEADISLPTIENVADVKYCINCGHKLHYIKLYSAHLGIYKCTNCDFKRYHPQIKAVKANFKDNFSTDLQLTINHEPFTITYPLPGLYNAYNVLAAITVASELAIPLADIKNKVKNFQAAFGRFQSVKIPASPAGGRSKSVVIFLIKNPTGANEVIRTIASRENLNLLAVLNDNTADGRDVSWIWDTNWEALSGKLNNLFLSGNRKFDLGNRFKYAGFNIRKNQLVSIVKDALVKSLDALPPNETLLILPTYTALLEIEQALQEMGAGKWQEN